MAKFRLDSLAALARQLAFTPHDTLAVQLTSAEMLLTDLDAAKAYPLDFVVFRITGYRPKTLTSDLLTGLALQHDLGLLIEQLSETLGQTTAAIAEPVLAIEDLTERLNVTSKTIQRWRRRGLPARRFIFPDGKRRVGFVLSSVERFLRSQREPLENVNTQQIDDVELEQIVRHARRLLRGSRCCVDDMTRRIARRLNRSPLTILHTLRKHDAEHPGQLILPGAPAALDDDQKARIIRGSRRGQTIRALAQQARSPRSAVYRVLLAERIAKLAKRKVKFIDDPLYHQPDAGAVVQAIASQDTLAEQSRGDELRVPADLPSVLAELCRAPLLSSGLERALFLKLNFHKMGFVVARRRLDPELARARDLAELESHLKRATETRNDIIRANLRLVVSIARRHLRGSLPLMELVSEGTMTLMRAVDSFDVHRGHKFSTYATLALMKGFARCVPQMLWNRSGGASDPDMLADIADRREITAADRFLAREQVGDLLGKLDSRERDVLLNHYGLGDRTPATYDQLAQRLGLTKQRIRQIEQAALAKLRGSATSSII